MLYYCKKCGRIILFIIEDKLECDCCHSKVSLVPDEFLVGESKMVINNELKQQFINDYIKSSSEFDQYLFDHREEILVRQSAEFNAKMEHGRAVLEGRDKGNQFGVECPYCHATNVKKITNASKAIHTALFGIFSVSRNSKQWHCQQCNSDF